MTAVGLGAGVPISAFGRAAFGAGRYSTGFRYDAAAALDAASEVVGHATALPLFGAFISATSDVRGSVIVIDTIEGGLLIAASSQLRATGAPIWGRTPAPCEDWAALAAPCQSWAALTGPCESWAVLARSPCARAAPLPPRRRTLRRAA